MRLRHRRRPHSGLARHLNPPYGANRRHGGRLHIRAEGGESKTRTDRPKRRDAGGGTIAGGTTPGMTPAQLEMLQQSQEMSPASSSSMPYNPTAGGQKRGGRVGIKRARGGAAKRRADGGPADSPSPQNSQMQNQAQQPVDPTNKVLGLSPFGSKPHGTIDAQGQVHGMKKGGSADGHWMEKAFANSHGQFKAKAKKAGKSVAAEAAAVTKPGSHASTKTKRQANLAKLGAKYGGH